MKSQEWVELTSIMDLGKTIAKYRKLRNLSQAELAAKLDIHHAQSTHWEKGRSGPRQDSIPQLMEAFRIEVEEPLAGGPQDVNKIEDPELKTLLLWKMLESRAS